MKTSGKFGLVSLTIFSFLGIVLAWSFWAAPVQAQSSYTYRGWGASQHFAPGPGDRPGASVQISVPRYVVPGRPVPPPPPPVPYRGRYIYPPVYGHPPVYVPPPVYRYPPVYGYPIYGTYRGGTSLQVGPGGFSLRVDRW